MTLEIPRLVEWLSIDSTTGREAAFARRLEDELTAAGLRVRRQRVGRGRWNVFAAAPTAAPEVLLCTHLDTVPPFIPPEVRDGVIYARGACDTKGGLFAMLEAWRALPDALAGRVGFLLVVGEEVDHAGAVVAGRQAYATLRTTVLCEPTRGRVCSGQKGILKAVARAHGRAGHSAFPEAGESAIHELIAGLGRLLAVHLPAVDGLGDTTLNVGTVSGGVAANVFAPSAQAELLFRATVPVDDLERLARAALGPSIELETVARNEATRLLAWPDRFATDVVPFNTDAPYLDHLAPVVLAGPGDIRTAHSPDERISVAEIADGVTLYGELVRGLLEGTLPVRRRDA
ncbi:MAG: M20/M25/M40 family metallo-hydrolase [Myxococcales bacterium]|nr:M20/M25/M40 family metallo-hydrolase [Myxococcales bacterium]MCB9531706.1 M20/M25/M40 family metallo-hydrolase [Myxococcales bacterium]